MDPRLDVLANRLSIERGLVTHLRVVDGVDTIVGGATYERDPTLGFTFYTRRFEVRADPAGYRVELPHGQTTSVAVHSTEEATLVAVVAHFQEHFPDVRLSDLHDEDEELFQPYGLRAVDVPRRFWDRIEAAGGDDARYRDGLQALSKDELATLHREHDAVAQRLVYNAHETLPAEVASYSVETLRELACGVVSQGWDRYLAVLREPERFPRRHERGPLNYANSTVSVYLERFEEFPP